MNVNASFPPAPWDLRGWGIATVQLVESRVAQSFVPAGCRVVAVVPGRTLGGLLFLSYEAGSTLVYRELNVVAALVRVGTRLAFYLPRLYVDSPASLAGGRAIWGMPKEAAEFDVASGEGERTIVVRSRSGDVFRLRAKAARTRLRLAWPVPALGARENRFLFFTGFARARCGFAGVTVEVPGDWELAALALDRPRLSLSLEAFELIVPAAVTVLRNASRHAPRCRGSGEGDEPTLRERQGSRWSRRVACGEEVAFADSDQNRNLQTFFTD